MVQQGDHPLFNAIRRGTPDDVARLLAAGADPDIASKDGKHRPLSFAAETGMSETYRKEMIALLIGAGAKAGLPAPAGDSALHAAVRRGDRTLAGLFLAQGADLHAQGSGGQTPLHIAVSRAGSDGDVAMVDFLLASGANVLLKNARGQSALDLAADTKTTRTFGPVIFAHLKHWEANKDSLRRQFEKLHAERGFGAAVAAQDHRRLAAVARSGGLHLQPASKKRADRPPEPKGPMN